MRPSFLAPLDSWMRPGSPSSGWSFSIASRTAVEPTGTMRFRPRSEQCSEATRGDGAIDNGADDARLLQRLYTGQDVRGEHDHVGDFARRQRAFGVLLAGCHRGAHRVGPEGLLDGYRLLRIPLRAIVSPTVPRH